MKRLFALLLATVLLLSCFSGCDSKNTESVPPVNPSGLSLEENGIAYNSLEQKAVVKTAMAYWARKSRAQYDDTRLNVKGAPTTDGILYRWQSGVRQTPEEYTTQNPGYLNCAAFIHDVFWSALGLDIGASYTGDLAAIDDARRVYQYIPTGNETAAEKATVEQQFYAALQMGDIVVTRSLDNINGHTTLYVSKAVIKHALGKTDVPDEEYIYDCIHSSGVSYDYDRQEESAEKNGTIEQTSTRHIFNSSGGRYLFTKCKSLTIIRPLNAFDGEVPENTKNRMLNLENVVAEKLCSHTAGMTVNPGGELTYTFSIANNNTTPVTLAVTDTIPENTTFVSAENCVKKGQNLSWTVTVPAGETAIVSYTVKLKRSAKVGMYIESATGSVGGVAVTCPNVYVGTTLTEDQQAALCAALEAYADSSLRGMELANAIYKDVLKTENLLPDDSITILSKLFQQDGKFFCLNGESTYYNGIAPGLFGGRYVPQRVKATTDAQQYQRYENRRTRMLTTDQLIVGDIIVSAQNADASRQRIFLYTGEKFVNLDTFTYVEPDIALNPVLSFHRFAVLRPSLMLDHKK